MKTPITIYGFHAVLAQLSHHPDQILALYCDEQNDSSRMQEVKTLAKEADIALQSVSRQKLVSLAQSEQHQGIVAQVKTLASVSEKQLLAVLGDWQGARPPLLLILEGIQDPHNIGACLRSAKALGVDFVLLPKAHTAPITPAVSKVASGALATLPIVMISNVVRTIEQLKNAGIWVLGTAMDEAQPLQKVDLARPIAWVMGPEGKGLKRLTLEACDERVMIPMQAEMDSLNVSVATGICLYETARQRRG